MKIFVRLSEPSSTGSVLLDEIASAVRQNALGSVERETQQLPGTKGELLTALIIGVATGVTANAVYDLIKAAIRRATDFAKSKGETPPDISIQDDDKD